MQSEVVENENPAKRARVNDSEDFLHGDFTETYEGKSTAKTLLECGNKSVGSNEKESLNQEEEKAEGEDEVIYQFSDEEMQALVDDARCEGFWSWVGMYSRFGLGSLLNAFSVSENDLRFLSSDVRKDEQLRRLKSVFTERITRRVRLEEYHSFNHAVELIRKSKKILILTGAGVSVSCGIPDFRSKNGIYSRLAEFQLSDPQEMFDLEYFKFNPKTFYSFAKEIYPSNFKPSPSHHFIKMLERENKLLRNYTQNIDTLENIVGIERVIQCHGSFATAKCILCGHQVPGKAIEEDIFAQRVPSCSAKDCKEGIIKPDIVFFGESLPRIFHDCFALDRLEVDLLIVMGSSLKVAPVANVMHKIPTHVPQILINMESLPHMQQFDIHLLGYSDVVVQALSDELGYTSASIVAPICSPGPLPWIHLFEGALDPLKRQAVSDFSSSEESDSQISDDSNTEDGENEHDKAEDQESQIKEEVV